MSSQLASESSSGINIPHASVFTDNIYSSQRQVIEAVFAETFKTENGLGTGKVSVDLEHPLDSNLKQEIINKGYDVYQFYKTTINRTDQKFNVVIEPRIHSYRKNMIVPRNLLWDFY